MAVWTRDELGVVVSKAPSGLDKRQPWLQVVCMIILYAAGASHGICARRVSIRASLDCQPRKSITGCIVSQSDRLTKFSGVGAAGERREGV